MSLSWHRTDFVDNYHLQTGNATAECVSVCTWHEIKQNQPAITVARTCHEIRLAKLAYAVTLESKTKKCNYEYKYVYGVTQMVECSTTIRRSFMQGFEINSSAFIYTFVSQGLFVNHQDMWRVFSQYHNIT